MTRDPEETTPAETRDSAPTAGARPRSASHPKAIGPYRILELLGEGGFGQVYAAEQTEPVRRRVAVKLLKVGMDTKSVLARFEAERQALAMMDHPNIARVIDAGATELGRPYFVMDLIQGVPITDYCDRNRLTTRQRLELFISVCQAIQHAHTKGIIHRDVKPSNVLVTLVDDNPVPKVIDFGIAKATAGSLTDMTVHTMQGQMIGTPAYMSPEQSEMSGLNVDTRTDIYSLGVLLYELLTGTLPFDRSELLEAGLEGLQRIIREQEPPRPSTRISSLGGDDSVAVAAKHRTDPTTLRRRVRGELDWITMKAMEKDRARRYETVHALAEDLRRYLHSEPILARPPSRMYAFAKFVRRNRGLVGGVTATALALVAGVVVSVTFALREGEQRRAAVAARDDLQAVAEFQARMLGDVDAEKMGRELFSDLGRRLATARGDATADGAEAMAAGTGGESEHRLRELNPTDVALGVLDRNILERAEAAVSEEFVDQPAVRAQLEHSVGRTAFRLGLYERADRLLTRAAETFRGIGADSSAVAAHLDIGRVALFTGDWDRCETEVRSVIAEGQRLLDVEHTLVLDAYITIGLLQLERNEWAAAESTFAVARDMAMRLHGPDHVAAISTDDGLAHAWTLLEKYDEAAEVYAELVPRARRVLGTESYKTYQVINNAAMSASRAGRYDEALALYGEDLEASRRLLGTEHSEVHVSTVNLARLLVRLERYEEAEELGREALRVAVHTIERVSVPRGMSHAILGEALCGQKRYAEAEGQLEAAYEIFAQVFGPDSSGCTAMSRRMVEALEGQGKSESLASWKERAGTG